MPAFPVNPTRLDPYKNFKFRLKWDGKYVGGVSKISGLKRTTETVAHREGGDPNASRKSPGTTRFDPITLERGLTQDREFEAWANQVWQYGAAREKEVSLKEFRKDILIELLNEAGQPVYAYKIFRCWPSSYQALPDLDSQANSVAIERLILEYEGWERDTSVAEPAEP